MNRAQKTKKNKTTKKQNKNKTKQKEKPLKKQFHKTIINNNINNKTLIFRFLVWDLSHINLCGLFNAKLICHKFLY